MRPSRVFIRLSRVFVRAKRYIPNLTHFLRKKATQLNEHELLDDSLFAFRFTDMSAVFP